MVVFGHRVTYEPRYISPLSLRPTGPRPAATRKARPSGIRPSFPRLSRPPPVCNHSHRHHGPHPSGYACRPYPRWAYARPAPARCGGPAPARPPPDSSPCPSRPSGPRPTGRLPVGPPGSRRSSLRPPDRRRSDTLSHARVLPRRTPARPRDPMALSAPPPAAREVPRGFPYARPTRPPGACRLWPPSAPGLPPWLPLWPPHSALERVARVIW